MDPEILQFKRLPDDMILLVQGAQAWEVKALESTISWKYSIIAMDNWFFKHLYDTIMSFYG